MLELTFSFDSVGTAHDHPYLEAYELEMLFLQTQQELDPALRRKLDGLICATHQQAPKLHITATYDQEREQFELDYGVDTCCKPFLLRVVQRLQGTG